MRLPDLSGDALLLAEFWILPLAFFANLAPSRLVLEETACSNSYRTGCSKILVEGDNGKNPEFG